MTAKYSNTETSKLYNLNSRLTIAISKKDKAAILELYDEASRINMDMVKSTVFKAYDSLVDAGNEIVYQINRHNG